MRPNWAKALVVGDGFDSKRKPDAFRADHVRVALFKNNVPDEPGVVTGALLVIGPLQWMSTLQLAAEETGFSKRNSAFGMSWKSVTARCLAFMWARPALRLVSTGDASGSVQNNPSG